MLHGAEVHPRREPAHRGARSPPERNAKESEARSRLLPGLGQVGRAAVQADHVALVPLGEVQAPVLVQILRVPESVSSSTVRPGIADAVDPGPLRQALLAPHPPLVGDVAPDLPLPGIRFLVQDPQAPRLPGGLLHPVHVPRRIDEEGVLAHLAEIHDQGQGVPLGHVELQELAAAEVDSRRPEEGGDGAPPGLGEGRVFLVPEGQQHSRLPPPAPHHVDLAVDVLARQKALEDPDAVPGCRLHHPGVLPGEGLVGRHVHGCRQHVLGSHAARGRAAQDPLVRLQGDGAVLGAVEIVDVDGTRGVGIGDRDRQLATDVHCRGLAGTQAGDAAQEVVEPGGAEAEVRIHASQGHRRRLHPEGRTVHEGVLGLIEPEDVDPSPVADPMVAPESHHRRRRESEDLLLLPGGPKLGVGSAGEEEIGIQESHRPDGVVDGVVDPPDQKPVSQIDALAPVPNPQRPQREAGDPPGAPDAEGDRQAKEPGLPPFEEVRLLVDPGIGVGPEDEGRLVGAQPLGGKGRGTEEGLEGREDQESPRHRRLIQEVLLRREVEPGAIQLVDRRLLVHPEEPEEGQVPTPGPPLERPPRAELTQGDGELHRLGIHVAGARDPIHLVHLPLPGGPAGPVARPRRLEELQHGLATLIVDPLGIVRPHRIAGGGHVRHRQHLLPGQGSAEGDPEPAGVDHVVHSGLEVAEPPRLPDLVHPRPGHRLRLDVSLHLLTGHRVGLEAVELDGLGTGRHRRRRIGRREGQGVDVGVARQRSRIHEEEELTPDVVGVVDDEGVLLDESRSAELRALESERPGGDLSALLRPDGLEPEVPDPGVGPESEVARRNALGQEAGAGEIEGDVPHLEALDQLPRQPLVVHVDVVGGRELPGLVVVHVHVDPLGDVAPHVHPELHVGTELGKEPGVAGVLDGRVTRTEAVPLPTHLHPSPKADSQVGEASEEVLEGIGRRNRVRRNRVRRNGVGRNRISRGPIRLRRIRHLLSGGRRGHGHGRPGDGDSRDREPPGRVEGRSRTLHPHHQSQDGENDRSCGRLHPGGGRDSPWDRGHPGCRGSGRAG